MKTEKKSSSFMAFTKLFLTFAMNSAILKMNQISVELTDLSIGYRTKQGKKVVASHIEARIHRGRLTCLLGENGVGKSTLLRTLAAFQPPLSGQIQLEGQPLAQYSDRQLARTIGIVLTEKPDVRQMTARELVEMGRAPYTGFWGRLNDADHQACDEAIGMTGIAHLVHRHIHTLSDGERQKVMIAKALAQQTSIIYLDEPTAFLDYPSKVEMLLLLRRISHEAQKTVFLSTHDLELALQVADTIWLMTREKGLQTGTPRELAANGTLSQFIERHPDIHFDPATLSIGVQSHDAFLA